MRKITNPGLLKMQAENRKSIEQAIAESKAFLAEDAIATADRIDLAREFAGDLAQDAEANEDGSVTVHLARKLTPAEIVAHVVSNARLEGLDVPPETLAVVEAIANGSMTTEQAAAWRKARAAELQKKP